MIAVLDWGIGGFGTWKLLRAADPRRPLLYFSDAGFTPYGKVPAAQLAARVRQVASLLVSRGATHLVVACNAASTVLPRLGVSGDAGQLDVPGGTVRVTGIIRHAVRLARRSRPHRLGIVGGQRTIRSRAYRRALAGRGVVIQRVAQPLSAFVEAGDLDSKALRAELRRILAPLRTVDALLLACTHYPALSARFAELLPNVKLLDPAEELVAWVESHWTADRSATPAVLTTGSADLLRRAADRAFGVAVGRAQQVVLRAPRLDV